MPYALAIQQRTAKATVPPRKYARDTRILPMPKSQQNPRDERDSKVLTRPKQANKTRRPRLYRILLHNDDFTPREFVVLVLRQVFAKAESESTGLMLHVHNTGVGVVGLYPFSVAETKIAEVTVLAQESDFPLLFTMEPDLRRADPSS